MNNVEIQFEQVDELPVKRYSKASKYDAIIQKFLDGDMAMAHVKVGGLDASNLRTAILKRLDKTGETRVSLKTVNGEIYFIRN